MKIQRFYAILFLTLISCNGSIENVLTETAINPPFKGVEIPFQTNYIDPNKDNFIETKKGTRIYVPANSLVDATGEILTKKVTLNYRSFHSAAEIIASGIPLQYDSLGTTYDFLSGGMLELKAFADEQEVFIKEGAEIEVEFASFNEGDGFNLYAINEESGVWNYIEPSNAIENTRKDTAIQAFKDQFLITLDIDYKEQPELAIFEELSWIYSGENEAENPINNPWIFEEKWREIELNVVDKEQAIYTMHLTSVSKTADLVVSPYVEGDEEVFMAALDEGILAYNETVKARKDEEFALQIQADMVRKFEISEFGTYNIDKINQMIESEEIMAVDARFLINGQEIEQKSDVILFSGDEKNMLIRNTMYWEDLYLYTNQQNALMIVLPNNRVAICAQQEFENAQKTTAYSFNFSKQFHITSFEELEELIETI